MTSDSVPYPAIDHAEDLASLYRRHVQGAYVRSSASLICWFFAYIFYNTGQLGLRQLTGITIFVIYLVIINPPTLVVLKHAKSRAKFKYASLLINMLEIMGYTAIIYFVGGIAASFLVLMYAAMITYVGIVGPRPLPFILAVFCSASFSLMVALVYLGIIPNQSMLPENRFPLNTQIAIVTVTIGLLFVVAFIASYTAGLLAGNRKKLQDQYNDLAAAHEQLRDEIDRSIEFQKALRESENYLKTVFDSVQTGLVIIEAETHMITDINVRAAQLIGGKREDIVGSICHDFICPVERGKCPITDLGMSIDNSERLLVKMSGDRMPIIKSVTPITLRGRTCLVETFTDITELKKAYEQIENLTAQLQQRVSEQTQELWKVNKSLQQEVVERKRSEERYRTILENIEDGFFELDLAGNITFFNDAACRNLGYPPEDLMGMNYRNYCSPETAGAMSKSFSEIYRTGSPVRIMDFEVIKKDRSRINIQLSASLKRDSAGQPDGFRCVARDVTDLKRAQEELRESEEKHRAIIENMDEGYIEVDLAGRLTFFNEAARNFLGYNREELMGMHYKQYVEKAYRENIFRLYNEVYRTKIPKDWFEWEAIRKDGVRRIVEGSASLISDAKGQPVGFRSLFRDVTDRRRLQEEREQLQERLHRAEKMESLGTMAGGVAHDLNNVLGVLVGYSELLLMEMAEGNPWRTHISRILQSSQRASAIIEDLLTLTRRGVVVSAVVNLNTVIADYLKTPEFEKLKLHHPRAKFKVELDHELLNVKGSPVHLGKTVMNLVSNAAEAISDRGEVKIQTKNLYLDMPIKGYDEVQQGDYVVLTVSDNGRGISSQDIEKVFEPFYTKKVMGRSGTGLGLAVVWGTVKDHNGYIDIQSEEGKGTTFTLYFPVTREDVSDGQTSTSISEYIGDGESILVVDDVEGQRELAAQMLEKLNYTVATVSGGEEAVEFVKKDRVDLIVLDMIMDPGIDGLDTYERILKINPGQKAIIVSGYSETDRVKRAQELGAGAYVRKPYILEKIGLAVRKELDKR